MGDRPGNAKSLTEPSAGRPNLSHGHVCPAWGAFFLDNWLRRRLFGSRRLSRQYVRPGMVCLDVGCGPAPMLKDLARAVGPTGKVLCVDIQQKMLDRVQAKVARAGIEDRVKIQLSEPDKLEIEQGSVDFAIAFWMLHETPDPLAYLEHLVYCLKPDGKLLIIEPRFHVTDDQFEQYIAVAVEQGLELIEKPKVRMSSTALFQRKQQKP